MYKPAWPDLWAQEGSTEILGTDLGDLTFSPVGQHLPWFPITFWTKFKAFYLSTSPWAPPSGTFGASTTKVHLVVPSIQDLTIYCLCTHVPSAWKTIWQMNLSPNSPFKEFILLYCLSKISQIMDSPLYPLYIVTDSVIILVRTGYIICGPPCKMKMRHPYSKIIKNFKTVNH